MNIARKVQQAGATLCALVALNVVSPKQAEAFTMVVGSIGDMFAEQKIRECTHTAFHTVQPGDSFARIAWRYYGIEAVDVPHYGGRVEHVYLPQWIADENSMQLTDTIHAGQVVRVPYVLRDECRRH